MSPLKTNLGATPRGTATAPLLFWLAVICGLVGITFLRVNDPHAYIPLWFGSVVGISIGQLLGVLRLRIWLIAVACFMLSWFIVPATVIFLAAAFGEGPQGGMEQVALALVPAAICGYASLSERGGLIAFWYPTMLWMLVILDGAAPGSFSPHKSLPLVIGLATLFIMFLRARETRRATLWQSYATIRLAATSPRTMLRASPLRGIGQLAWTGIIGAGTFLLAATIAPTLWQKEKDARHHDDLESVQASSLGYSYSKTTGMPCCPEKSSEDERIKEYLPIHGADRTREHEYYDSTCEHCTFDAPAEQAWQYGPGSGIHVFDEHWRPHYEAYWYDEHNNLVWGDAANRPNPSGYTYDSVPSGGNYGNGYGYNTPSGYVAPTVDTPYVAPYVPPPAPVVKPVKHPTKLVHTPVVTKPVVAAPLVEPVVVQPPPPVVAKPKAPVVAVKPPEPSVPWGLILPLLVGAFTLPLASRVVRRKLTLRHLARPFWRESVDQQISNHWQRMLIGLRDAGIHLRTNEQPQAFAKRVGIAGLAEAATILERVRHGVRIEADDLRAMNEAATTIYRSARDRAGIAGRVAGSFRWPLV